MLARFSGFHSVLPQFEATRRGFILGAGAIAGGLVLGFRQESRAAESVQVTNPFAAYVAITKDDRVTVISSQFDMGQGCYHGIATLVVEELGARFDQIDVVGGSGDTKIYGNLAWGGLTQATGGSSSMASSFDRYRIAGAVARAMLIAAAATEWGVPGAEVTVSMGTITHNGGRTTSLGALAEKAAALPVPAEVPLREPNRWIAIGNEKLRRFDSGAKCNGMHPYTIDIKLPELLTAVMVHPPKFGARVKSFDGTSAKAMPGVVDVVKTPRGVAVVAEHMWAAVKGRKAVTVEWDETTAETRGSAEIMAEYRELALGTPAAIARRDGDSTEAMARADRIIEATYEFPYLAHAAMEPLNAVARMNHDGTLEVWGGHQMPDLYQYLAAQVAGTTPDKVRLHVMKTGGGFGRRLVGDADVIVEAVATARAISWRAPVKVQWTREDDMKGGRYRPAYIHTMKAGLDKAGRIVAWEHHIVGQSIMKNGPMEQMIQNGVDPTSVEGAFNLPYALPNQTIGLTTTDVGVPALWWRSVGSTHNAFAVETFLDELAIATGADPLAFRLDLLSDAPRHAAVLKIAAEKADWGAPAPEGRARGIALAEGSGTCVAQVAELSVQDNDVQVHKVVCAVDCGVAVNPDNVRAQIEGGIGFGLGAVLAEELTLTKGKVDQANYDSYTPLRIDTMPEIEIHIVPSKRGPTGVGEPGVPPIGPAVANAIYAATGKRIRQLPIVKAMSSS